MLTAAPRPGAGERGSAGRWEGSVRPDPAGAHAFALSTSGGAPAIRRRCARCAAAGEAERGTGVRQPLCPACEREREAGRDGPLVARRAVGASPSPAAPRVRDTVRAVVGSGGGRPLDAGTRAFFEAGFGRGLGGVRVHTGAAADASARAVHALAYAVGRDVVFRAGYFSPETAGGRRLLAHELAHVVQQSGAPGAEVAARLEVGAADDPAEREADAAADAVLAGGAALPALRRPPAVMRQGTGGAAALDPCPLPSAPAGELTCASTSARGPRCALTPVHDRLFAAALLDAQGRVRNAIDAMNLPGGFARAEAAARALFAFSPPSIQEIVLAVENVSVVVNGAPRFGGATCLDPDCRAPGVEAFSTGAGQLPIYICPRSWWPAGGVNLAFTILHEAAHVGGIDVDPLRDERYCSSGTACAAPCLSPRSADAWAHFIFCFGAAPPAAPARAPAPAPPGPARPR